MVKCHSERSEDFCRRTDYKNLKTLVNDLCFL